MSSAAQIAANQTNAKLSTGPVTEAGKQTVSRNAVSHGLAGSNANAVLPGEESAFEDFAQGYIASYNPVGLPEQTLVRVIAREYWRLERAHAMENALFERLLNEFDPATPHVVAFAESFLDPAKGLRKITAYVNQIQRALDKNLAELKALQAERKRLHEAAKQEAILLTKLAHSKGQKLEAKDFPPPEQSGGFVYSYEAIAAEIIRAARLDEARARFQQQPE